LKTKRNEDRNTMEITAQMVSRLREATGAGMMECKKALVECDGDFERAVDLLRIRGKAGAEKRAGRAAAEGVVAVAVADGNAAMLELNSETDFVARNESFQEVAKIGAALAAMSGVDDVAALRGVTVPETVETHAGKSLGDLLDDLAARLRENIVLRRCTVMRAGAGEVIGTYVHTVTNKIGVLVKLAASSQDAKVAEVARNVAMHVAASKPQYLNRGSVPAEVLERERQVLAEKTRNEGKPEAAIPKIVEGRLNKFYEETCLEDQPYVRDPSVKVGALLKDAGAKAIEFRMYVVGQD